MRPENNVILSMGVDECDFEFALSIDSAITMANDELLLISETIRSVNDLKLSCDKLDYALAVSSGAICGLLDIFLVGKPGESPVGDVSDKWFKDRVKDFAKLNGWKEDCGKSAIRFLELKFDVPYDQTGRGASRKVFELAPTNHHFKSLAHNPTLLGLFFSILDQFLNQSHFVTRGELVPLKNADDGFELKGDTVPAKFFCGFANWLGHLISDMAGSSGSKGRGMGLPSPLWAWTNDIIAIGQTLGIPTPELVKNANALALIIYEKGYDARFQTAQAVPVIANEAIARLLYSIRRMVRYLSKTPSEERAFSEMWNACEPFANPTVKRMLTVAHGAFCMLDSADATIRAFSAGAGTFNAPEFFMRLNIVGVGRFTISLLGEGQRGLKVHAAKADVNLAIRKNTIVDDYLRGLQQLSTLYDDGQLIEFINAFKNSEMYAQAFYASASLAEIRNVPEEKVLRTKSDIDLYFAGGEQK